MSGELLIGIDLSTDFKKIGLTRARFDGEYLVDVKVLLAHDLPRLADLKSEFEKLQLLAEHMATWLKNETKALLCFDAPLGWPASMAAALANHKAGAPILEGRNDFFRRETDRFCAETSGKRPMDVGAERIARTAHFAMDLLSLLRHKTGKPIPVLTKNTLFTGIAAAETYPAATVRLLLGRSFKAVAHYRTEPGERSCLAAALPRRGKVKLSNKQIKNAALTADITDSMLCAVTGAEILKNNCWTPQEAKISSDLAEKEGWIWLLKKD